MNVMTDTMLTRIAETIHRHYSWIDAADHIRMGTQLVQCYGELHERNFRMLTLTVRRPRKPYKRDHQWNIPEHQLDKAVSELLCDGGFRKRWNAGEISIKDAEDIVLKASFGIIKLELEEPY